MVTPMAAARGPCANLQASCRPASSLSRRGRASAVPAPSRTPARMGWAQQPGPSGRLALSPVPKTLQMHLWGQNVRHCRLRTGRLMVTGASSAGTEPPPPEKKVSTFNLPTMLTIARVVAVPILVAVFYAPVPWAAPAAAAVFVVASLTDWLDGYLARKMNLVSAFGAFLDPVADKLMVGAALVLLCQRGPVAGPAAEMPWLLTLPSIAILGREITMSALREWAAASGTGAHKAVAVNSLGKWKTATQMAALTVLLLCRDGGGGAAGAFLLTAGPVLLYISAILAVWSLAVYFAGAWPYMAGS